MPEGTQAEREPSTELVVETINAHMRTAALRAAVQLDLFTAIGEGCDEVTSLARRCEASERGIRVLADYLVVIGLLKKSGGKYAHTPASAAFLDTRSPHCLAEMVGFLNHRDLLAAFDDLATVVRYGRTAMPGQGTVEDNNRIWLDFAHGMAPMMAYLAGSVGDIVLAGGGGPMRVLDIAAGHGLFGIEVAKRNPEAQIVALDWAAVLEVARENAAIAGVSGRYRTIAGSAFEVDFEGPYELALLTNFLHHFDPPTCVRLLRKVGSSLTPGGRTAALEYVPSEDRVSPPAAASFSLLMLASTAGGDAYTHSELERMHREAGFSRITAHPVPRSPRTLVVGHLD